MFVLFILVCVLVGTMVTILLVLLLAVPAAFSSSASSSCCEWDAKSAKPTNVLLGEGAFRVGSKAYSCGFPSSDLSYILDNGAIKCRCGKPQQNCPTDLPERLPADYSFVSKGKKGKVPLAKVNDNFCDSGDDEPATSACSGDLNSNLAAFFYCSAGIPKLLPVSRVDDGVVDCCDCSDEPRLREKCDPRLCANERYELEQVQRERDDILRGGVSELASISQTSAEEHRKLKAEVDDQAAKLDSFARGISEKKLIVEREEKIEKQEREERKSASWRKLVSTLNDPSIVNSISLADVAASLALEKGEAGIQRLRSVMLTQEMEDADSCVVYRRSVQADDVDVKLQRVLSWDESTQGPMDERNKALREALVLGEAPRDLLWRALEASRDDHRKIVQLLREKTGKITGQVDQSLRSVADEMDQHHVRPEAEEARGALSELEQEEAQFKSKMARSEKLVALDFGTNATLIHLLNKEFTLQVGEHLYKLRPFEGCEQGSTSLGKYTGWKALQEGSADVPQEINEGRAVPKPSILMTFENGQRCYQGTIRSTSVFMRCGAGDALIQVYEPEVCRYVFLFRTPVACADAGLLASSSSESIVSSLWRKAKSLFKGK